MIKKKRNMKKVISEPETGCVSHKCTACGKDLYTSSIFKSFVMALIIMSPLVTVMLLNKYVVALHVPECFTDYTLASGGVERVYKICP